MRVLVSRTRPPAFLDRLAERIELTLIPMGSAGAKAAAVITGDADAYLHSGGQYEWDSAAPVAVAQAAGLHTSRLDGSPLAYNQADPSLPDILICPADSQARCWIACAQSTVRLFSGSPGWESALTMSRCPTTRSLLDGRDAF